MAQEWQSLYWHRSIRLCVTYLQKKQKLFSISFWLSDRTLHHFCSYWRPKNVMCAHSNIYIIYYLLTNSVSVTTRATLYFGPATWGSVVPLVTNVEERMTLADTSVGVLETVEVVSVVLQCIPVNNQSCDWIWKVNITRYTWERYQMRISIRIRRNHHNFWQPSEKYAELYKLSKRTNHNHIEQSYGICDHIINKAYLWCHQDSYSNRSQQYRHIALVLHILASQGGLVNLSHIHWCSLYRICLHIQNCTDTQTWR